MGRRHIPEQLGEHRAQLAPRHDHVDHTVRVHTATAVSAAGQIPVAEAEAVDEEPIFRAIKRGYRQARDAWDRSSFNT
ncbi:MAG: hypothetical protein ACXWIO_08840, partial [Croceibacterium sp.]